LLGVFTKTKAEGRGTRPPTPIFWAASVQKILGILKGVTPLSRRRQKNTCPTTTPQPCSTRALRTSQARLAGSTTLQWCGFFPHWRLTCESALRTFDVNTVTIRTKEPAHATQLYAHTHLRRQRPGTRRRSSHYYRTRSSSYSVVAGQVHTYSTFIPRRRRSRRGILFS
jgi:hypothetical protein